MNAVPAWRVPSQTASPRRCAARRRFPSGEAGLAGRCYRGQIAGNQKAVKVDRYLFQRHLQKKGRS